MVLAEDVGSKWAVGLDGKGYLISTLDQESPFEYRSFAEQAVPLRTPRIDTSPEPGEASLGDLWVRAQHDWSGGRGQRVFDGENSDRHMSKTLFNLDPFLDGGNLSPGLSGYAIAAHNSQSWRYFTHGDLVYGLRFQTITRFDSSWTPESRSIGTIFAADNTRPYHNVVSDQSFFYYSTSLGIYKIDVTEAFGAWSSTEAKMNNLTDVEVLNFGKGRLIACKDNNVHVISDLGSVTSGATPHYTHIDTDWIWTDSEELGQGIYFSGYNGSSSKLYLMSFDTADAAAGLTIGIPREVWRAPGDEKILSITDYAGSAMLIGTSKGVRNVIIIDRDGNLVVGPLLETVNDKEFAIYDNKPYTIAIDGRYAYFPYKREDSIANKNQGMAKMDLSTFAFSVITRSYISNAPTGFSICVPPWFMDGDFPMYCAQNGVYAEQTMVPGVGNDSWYFDTGEIKWGSLVEKEFRSLTFNIHPTSLFSRDDVTIESPVNVSYTTTASWLMKMSLADWTPSSDLILALQGTDLDYHWKIQLETDGKLRFSYLDDTDTVTDYVSTVSVPSWILNEVVWIYVEMSAADIRFYYWYSNTDHTYPVFENFTQLGIDVTRTGTGIKNDTNYNTKPIVAGYDFATLGGAKRSLFAFDYYRGSFFGVVETQRIYGFRPSSLVDNEGHTWVPSIPIYGPVIAAYGIFDDKSPKFLQNLTGEQTYTLSFEDISFKTLRILLFGYPAYYSDIGPALMDWRMTSEPIPTPRYFRYYVPIMLYDSMTTLDGHRISRPGLADEYLGYLETLYRDGTAFNFQKPSGYLDPTGYTRVRIEEMEFKSYAPPEGASGFGGIALVVLKEIAT